MKKEYTIFYSWQSDSKDKSRNIIDKALKQAVDALKKKYGVQVRIDHSTLGTAGMPSIDQTILRKIDACDIFICDLTPVVEYNKIEGNGKQLTKQVPNPNVLIELGYAMSAIGVDYIIPVSHRGKWSPNEMPFDINHHSLNCFTTDSCNLEDPIWNVIQHIKKNGGHRHLDKPFFLHQVTLLLSKLSSFLPPKEVHINNDILFYHSTVFFKDRLSAAFPGERGLIEYTNQKKIRYALKKLLAPPLIFKESIDQYSINDPIWWFRAGSAMCINTYRYLGHKRHLIGWDEVRIKRLIAYIENGRYYKNYVYIEFDSDKPTKVYRDYLSPSRITDLQKEYLDVTEEYAIYKPCKFYSKKITKQEEDDGHTKIFGRIVDMKMKYECRTRHLTPFNIIIAAKQSSFNSDCFDKTSGEFLNGMLTGAVSKEMMNEYMMSLPKPHWQ